MGYNCQSILGVIIGITFIFCSCQIIADGIKFLDDFEQSVKDGVPHEPFAQIDIFLAYTEIVIASIAIVSNILLIIGIFKKRRYLLIPLMCLAVTIIIGQCLILLIGIIDGYIGKGAFYLGVELMVFCFTYMLYEDIRKTDKHPEQTALNTNQQNLPNYGHRTEIDKKYMEKIDGEN